MSTVMPIDFATALDAEIAALEQAIAQDPRVAKLRELKRVQTQFYKNLPSVGEDPGARAAPNNDARKPVTVGRRAGPEREKILLEAERLVRDNEGEPVPTKTIFASLQDLGVDIPGNHPINYVSAVLSTSGRLVANGRRGWTAMNDSDGHSSRPNETVAERNSVETHNWDEPDDWMSPLVGSTEKQF